MRFANADILPYNFTNFAETISMYVGDLQKLAAKMRADIEETNRQIDEGVFTATADPKGNRLKLPEKESVPPFLNFSPLKNAVNTLQQTADDYAKALDKFKKSGKTMPAGFNKKLLRAEQKLTSNKGLANRPWFKHQIYAPGFYTGYGVKTLPAVREAIEQKDWEQVDQNIEKVAGLLNQFSNFVASMTGILTQNAD